MSHVSMSAIAIFRQQPGQGPHNLDIRNVLLEVSNETNSYLGFLILSGCFSSVAAAASAAFIAAQRDAMGKQDCQLITRYGFSVQTVPKSSVPPSAVVPYRLPLASRIKPPSGYAPSVPPPEKLWSIVSFPLASSLNTTP